MLFIFKMSYYNCGSSAAHEQHRAMIVVSDPCILINDQGAVHIPRVLILVIEITKVLFTASARRGTDSTVL
jgi:hypothetical protein